MDKKDTIESFRRVTEIVHETMLCSTILKYGRSGTATPAMIEAAIALVDRTIAYCIEENDQTWLQDAEKMKAGLQQVLIDGVQSLRRTMPRGPEFTEVEEPLARFRVGLGHKIQRQKKCAGGIIDILDTSANQIIECKHRGTNSALGEAAGQLHRYGKSFPDFEWCIAVWSVQPDAQWMADLLRQQDILIIEVSRGL